MRFDEAVALLERRLGAELPGASAHALLAPIPRRQWPSGFNPARIRHAAGLLLLFPHNDSDFVQTLQRLTQILSETACHSENELLFVHVVHESWDNSHFGTGAI